MSKPNSSQASNFTPSTDSASKPDREPSAGQDSTLGNTSDRSSSGAGQQPSSSGSSGSGGSSGGGSASGKKSLFDETEEEAHQKKEFLRKLASGDAEAARQVKAQKMDPELEKECEADDSKDPVYNMRQAAKEDYYQPAKDPKAKEDELVTIAASKLLVASPDELAAVAKGKPVPGEQSGGGGSGSAPQAQSGEAKVVQPPPTSVGHGNPTHGGLVDASVAQTGGAGASAPPSAATAAAPTANGASSGVTVGQQRPAQVLQVLAPQSQGR